MSGYECSLDPLRIVRTMYVPGGPSSLRVTEMISALAVDCPSIAVSSSPTPMAARAAGKF